MVFFTCNSCGTSLKKNQVERHFGCSRYVSCMDCQKEFCGDEYKAHTKCISEEEKYNGPDWKAPSSRNKGERKQAAWMETINALLETGRNSMDPKKVALLKMIAERDNVPKKKAKFLNFISNIAKNSFDLDTVEAVFALLVAQWTTSKTPNKDTGSVSVLTETGDNVSVVGTASGADIEKHEISQENVEDKRESKKKSKKSKRKEESETKVEEIGTAQDGGGNDLKIDDNTGKSRKRKRMSDKDKVEVNETIPENCSENVQVESKERKSKKNKRKKLEIQEIGQDFTKIEKSKEKKSKRKIEKDDKADEKATAHEDGKYEIISESKIKKQKKNKRKKEKGREAEIVVKKSKVD